MAVRAASWAFLGLIFAVAASAAEGPLVTPAADSPPVATAARLGGDESQTRFVMDLSRKIDLHAFTLADPYRVVLDIPQVTFALAAENRRERTRPYQGLPLRAGDAGRLAHGVRSGQAGAHRQGLRHRRIGRCAGAAGARARARPIARAFCARSPSTAGSPVPRCRTPAGRRRTAAIRVRWSRSIPVTAASTPAPRGRTESRRRISSSISPSACVSASKSPENTAWS